MNKHDIYKGLKDGSITVNFNGHFETSDPEKAASRLKDFIEDFCERYEHDLDCANGGNDGKWHRCADEKESVEEVNKGMREYYAKDLDRDWGFSWNFYEYRGRSCYCCGERIFCYFDNEKNEIYVATTWRKEDLFKNDKCEMPKLVPYGGTLKVDDKLVFANYFENMREDSPHEEKWDEKYNINYHAGRTNTCKWKLAHQGVAYGQMGNMSVGVYLKKDKKHIILTSPYIHDYGEEEGANKEFIKKLDTEYIFKGQISLCVWRWEATNLRNTKVTLEDIKTYKEKLKKGYSSDYIVLDVPKGDWEFIHYYDCHEDDSSCGVYSEFRLMED